MGLFNPDNYLTVGVPQRISFAVANAGGGVSLDTPATMTFKLEHPSGKKKNFTAKVHNKNLPFSYYQFDYVLPEKGNYFTSSTVDGHEVSAAFAVGAKGSSPVPAPMSTMPSLVTPTVTDPHGIDPLCTNDPPCPLHSVSLDAALAEKKPVAYLVATPKFCQTGICGPVLDVLLSEQSAYADKVTMIHQEVYQSATEAAEKGANATLAPALKELGLVSEPVLFLIGRDGIVTRRLDSAYDSVELRAGLDALLV